MEPDSYNDTMTAYNDTMAAYLTKLNDDIALDLLPAVILFGIFMIVGVVGNSLVVYVFFYKLRRSSQNFFIAWLAIIDLVTSAVSMPTEMQDLRYQIVFNSRLLCRFMRFFNNCSTCCSILMLIALAADRYRKVCQPLKRQITIKVAKLVLLAVLVISAGFSFPAFLLFGLKSIEIKPYVGVYGHTCSVDDSVKDSVIPVIYLGTVVLVIIVSCIALSSVYIHIWLVTRRHNLNMVKKGIVSPYSSIASAAVTTIDRWVDLRNKLGLKGRMAKGNAMKPTPSQSTVESTLSHVEPESSFTDSRTDSCCIDSPEQSQNLTTNLFETNDLFKDDSRSDINQTSVPFVFVSDRENGIRGIMKRRLSKRIDRLERDNTLSTFEPVWSEVVDMMTQAGTDSVDAFTGENYPSQHTTSFSEAEHVQALSKTISATVLDVCAFVSDNVHIVDNSFMPEDQTPPVDKSSHNAADMSFSRSGNYYVEESATDARSLSPVLSSCHPHQSFGKQENVTVNALTRDTIEDKRGQTCFCILPGADSASTKHMRSDSSVTTPTTNTNINSQTESPLTILGKVLSLSTIPVIRILSTAQQNSDDSGDNVVGHIRIEEHKPVVKLKRNKLTKTTAMITVVFFLSFVPYMVLIALRLLEVISIDIEVRGARLCLYHIFTRSFFLNSVSNPIIYAGHIIKFRQECIKLLRRLVSIGRRLWTTD